MSRYRKFRNSKAFSVIGTVAVLILAVLYVIDALNAPEKKKVVTEECAFHFVDVGQGDCTMAIANESVIVVDCGPGDRARETCAYIESYTDTIDYLVLTHPHEDHIGGAQLLLSEVKVKNVIMSDATTDTKVFDDLLCALDEKNVNVIEAKAGSSYKAGDLELTILTPLCELESLNDYSVVSRISYKDTSVMVTGDVEHNSERLITEEYSRSEIRSDILKISHHGSKTSNLKSFVEAVDPEYAVAQCGENNSYGHPHWEVVQLLDDLNIDLYRNDQMGSVVFVTDGEGVELKKDQ